MSLYTEKNNSIPETDCDEKEIFFLKTHDAHSLKKLTEVLSNYLSKTGSFKITKEGIFLRNVSSRFDVMCDLVLPAKNFGEFRLNNCDEFFFSVNLSTLYQELRKTRRNDGVSLQIVSEKSNMFLKIMKESSDSNIGSATARTSITTADSTIYEIPTDYGPPITVLCKAYHSACREIGKPTDQLVTVTWFSNRVVRFNSSKNGTVSNMVMLGEGKNQNNPGEKIMEATYASDHITFPDKLCAISQIAQIYSHPTQPLCIEMSIGCLGKISIYIKSTKQLQSEADTADYEEHGPRDE